MDVMETAQQVATAPKTDKLAGRVAFVTGGTRGIGAAIARSLAAQGATVAVGYSRDEQSAEQFVTKLTAICDEHGAPASMHQGNVGSAGDCRRTIAEVIDPRRPPRRRRFLLHHRPGVERQRRPGHVRAVTGARRRRGPVTDRVRCTARPPVLRGLRRPPTDLPL